MTDKWVFIVNPVAGSGSARSQLPVMEKMIGKHNIDAEVVTTRYKGHASELSAEYLDKGFRYFIGVGGDGTLNEIARPLINKPDIILGLIPAGTGNDFNQIPGFHDRFTESDWEVFFRKNIIAMDAGSVNGMIFLNGMGLGFDAQVASENYDSQGNAKEGGKNRYIWQIIKTLLFFREKRMIALTGNVSTETDCFINTIAIGRRFAGGFLLTPRALANDGLLDVCSIKRLSLPERFNILLKVPKGKHINDRRINYYQTPAISLEFPEAVPFHVDGELFFQKRFDVTLIPGALNIIYNPDGPHFFSQ
jgi:YegS/Rv2252/BmrU family lipid kinase